MQKTNDKDDDREDYLWGFGNHHESEARPSSLPIAINTPRLPPLGLYTEQLSGTAFTATPRHANLRTWMYRVLPSVANCQSFKPIGEKSTCTWRASLHGNFLFTPRQLRWPPLKPRKTGDKNVGLDWLEGLRCLGKVGEPALRHGLAIHVYTANTSMHKKAFYNADGDLLIGILEKLMDLNFCPLYSATGGSFGSAY